MSGVKGRSLLSCILLITANQILLKRIYSLYQTSLPYRDAPSVTWLNVSGVHDENIIHNIGEIYNIHPLVLEDVANTTQRPKMEEHDNYLFVVIKMGYFSRGR